MTKHSRRNLLKAVTGIGIGTTATGIFGGTVSAAETLPNDLWSYDLNCDQDSSCPGTVTSGDFMIRDDDKFTTVGSYGFNWYGTAYGNVLGWAHGLGFGGGCESIDNDSWDGIPHNLRGQRYSIHVPNPTSQDEILKGTSNHLHGVHPSPNNTGMSWAETIVKAGIENAMGAVNFGIPIGTLLEAMADYDGFDFNQHDVGYGFSHTSKQFPSEPWQRCAHSDAVIYTSGDYLLETVKMKHGYLDHSEWTGMRIWNDKEYTVAGFDPTSSISTSSNDLTTSGSDVERPNSKPSSGHPDEMTPEERKQWGIKSVKGKGIMRNLNGVSEEVTYVLTKNPFTVIDEKITTEKVEAKG